MNDPPWFLRATLTTGEGATMVLLIDAQQTRWFMTKPLCPYGSNYIAGPKSGRYCGACGTPATGGV